MQAIIITELLKITEGKVTTNFRVINLDGQEPILNNQLGFVLQLNKYVPLTTDTHDKTGKTLQLQTSEFDDQDIVVQYTNVVNLKDFKVIPVVRTEKSVLTSKTIELQYEPRNLFGLCPLLNFGYALVRSPAHGTSIKVPTGPNPEDKENKSIQMQISDEAFEQLKDKEVTIQYIYEYQVDKVTELPVMCSETATFENGLIKLSSTIKNINGESQFLNFGLAATVSDRPMEFEISKLDDQVCGSPFFTQADLEVLEGQQIQVQYITTVDPKVIKLDSKLMDTKAINGFPLNYSDMKLDESAKQDEKLQKIAKGFAENAPSTITRNGEIIDGEFTVVKNPE
jgi:hypothetical protein